MLCSSANNHLYFLILFAKIRIIFQKQLKNNICNISKNAYDLMNEQDLFQETVTIILQK